jgi:hypothetical protein
MTTSDASSSRIVDVSVSSDSFVQISPEDLFLYRRGDPGQIIYTLSSNKLAHKNDATGQISLGALAALSLTNGDIIKIMGKIGKLVSDSPEGMSYKLNELFSEGKNKRYPVIPGTLRIFANNRACYYTGRSWRGIRLNKTGS